MRNQIIFKANQNRFSDRLNRFLFRVFLSVLDWSAFAIMMLSCGITILCMHFKWYTYIWKKTWLITKSLTLSLQQRFTDMPLSLLASGIIFPISFRYVEHRCFVPAPMLSLSLSLSSISYSSSRRERVLLDIASLKASMVALYALTFFFLFVSFGQPCNVSFLSSKKDINSIETGSLHSRNPRGNTVKIAR